MYCGMIVIITKIIYYDLGPITKSLPFNNISDENLRLADGRMALKWPEWNFQPFRSFILYSMYCRIDKILWYKNVHMRIWKALGLQGLPFPLYMYMIWRRLSTKKIKIICNLLNYNCRGQGSLQCKSSLFLKSFL